MNKDIFAGGWKEVKGQVKEKLGKLTDDDLTRIEGKKDQLIGALQKRYGYDEEQAKEEVTHFETELKNKENRPNRRI